MQPIALWEARDGSPHTRTPDLPRPAYLTLRGHFRTRVAAALHVGATDTTPCHCYERVYLIYLSIFSVVLITMRLDSNTLSPNKKHVIKALQQKLSSDFFFFFFRVLKHLIQQIIFPH